MKYKIDRMNKTEKNKIKESFFKTAQGKEIKIRLNRLLIYGVILLVFGCLLIIEAIIKKDAIAQIIYGCILLLFGIGFIISKSIIFRKKLNDYITKK